MQHVSVVDVKVPKDLKVGYIMGAGDEIPTVLRQIGMNVTLIPAEKLASEDLSRYQTIVLGIRAYDTQKDVIANNKRLLDFVQAGGRLVVQYNTLGYCVGGGFQCRQVHALSGNTQPGAGFSGGSAGHDSRSGEPDFSFSE